MTVRLSPQLKNQYDQLVQAEQRIRSFTTQREQWELQKASIENAVNELTAVKEKDPNTAVYKNAGAVLIKVPDIDKVMEELKEKKELLEMRIKTVTKQLERISQQYESMKEKFSQAVQQMNQPQDFQAPM